MKHTFIIFLFLILYSCQSAVETAVVATKIATDKGIPIMLPPKIEQENIGVKGRNVLNILINSTDTILVNGKEIKVNELKVVAKAFIKNNGADPNMSESPQKAVISLNTDLGTSYEMYVKVREVLQLAYNELRAEYVGLSVAEFLKISEDVKNPANKEVYDRAKDTYPVMISDAEPSDTEE